MAQGRVTDIAQLPQIVGWLDEQRQLDKDQLLAVQQDLERLGLSVREITAHISRIQDDLSQGHSRFSALASLEEGLRQARETLLILQQRVEEANETQGKDILLRQAEAERDHRALVDLGQQIVESRKLIEADEARVRAVMDEARRLKPSIEALSGHVEALDKAVSGAGSRLHFIDEAIRRQDSRLTVMEKATETLQADHSRMLQWQQAADLRWTRQLSTWQQQMEDWQREAEDRVKLVQQFIKQNASLKEEVQELRMAMGESHNRSEEHTAEVLRLESLRAHDREEVRRVEQAQDVQRRRLDEQSGTIKQIQEQFLQDVQELTSLESRLEAEQRRTDELGAQLTHLDQRQSKGAEDADQLRRDIRDLNQKLEQHIQRWRQQTEDDRRRTAELLEESQRLEEQQKLREISELERQIIEIRDRFVKVKAS